MIYNGLKGADLISFNYLREADLSQRISIGDISNDINYHPYTVALALKRLEEWGMIKRHREKNGQAYYYKILNGNGS